MCGELRFSPAEVANQQSIISTPIRVDSPAAKLDEIAHYLDVTGDVQRGAAVREVRAALGLVR